MEEEIIEVKEASVLLFVDNKSFVPCDLSIESGVLVLINCKTDEMDTYALENTEEYSITRGTRGELTTLLVKVPRRVLELSHEDEELLTRIESWISDAMKGVGFEYGTMTLSDTPRDGMVKRDSNTVHGHLGEVRRRPTGSITSPRSPKYNTEGADRLRLGESSSIKDLINKSRERKEKEEREERDRQASQPQPIKTESPTAPLSPRGVMHAEDMTASDGSGTSKRLGKSRDSGKRKDNIRMKSEKFVGLPERLLASAGEQSPSQSRPEDSPGKTAAPKGEKKKERSSRGSESLRIHKKINSGLVSLDSLFAEPSDKEKEKDSNLSENVSRALKDNTGSQTVSGKFSSKLTGFGGRPDSNKEKQMRKGLAGFFDEPPTLIKADTDFPRVASNIIFETLPDVDDVFSYSEGGERDYQATLLYKNSKKNELHVSIKDSLSSLPEDLHTPTGTSSPPLSTSNPAISKSAVTSQSNSPPTELDEEQGVKRKFIAREMFTTEKSYLESLRVGHQSYQLVLVPKASLFGETEARILSIFGTWENILAFHEKFFAKLEVIVDNMTTSGGAASGLGDFWNFHIPFLAMYAPYAEKYAENFKFFCSLEKKHSKFKAEVDACHLASKFSLRLNDLLIVPVQRIPRYVLLVTDYLKNTPATHPDFVPLTQALKNLSEIAVNVNEAIRKRDNVIRFQELCKEGIDLGKFSKSTNHFIRDGVVKVVVRKWAELQLKSPSGGLATTSLEFPSAGETDSSASSSASGTTTLSINSALSPLGTNEKRGKAKEKVRNAQHWFLFNDVFIHVKQRLVTSDIKESASVPLSLCWLSHEGRMTKLRLPNEELLFEDPEWEGILEQAIVSATHSATQETRTPHLLKYIENNPLGYRVAEYRSELTGHYIGQYLDGRRHGLGKWVHKGNVYKGEWKDDLFHGKGRLKYCTGGVCYGTWDAGRQSGLCKFKQADGTVGLGYWVNGVRQGYGTIIWPNKDSYQGNWKRDRWHGLGRLTCHSGLIYVGHFDKNTFHGVGKLSLPNGMSYEGHFERGLRSGKGKMTYSDGSTYIGAFENGAFNGAGLLTRTKGEVYNGWFVNDLFEGVGELTYPDGSIYLGEFKRNLRWGKGKMTFSHLNNTVYEGEWEMDLRHGNGQMQQDGNVFVGTWVNDKMDGGFSVTYADGGKFDGLYVNGQKSKGKYVINEKDYCISSYDGDFSKGLISGKGTMVFGNGKSCKGTFDSGTFHGLCNISIPLNAEKTLLQVSSFSHDTMDGQVTFTSAEKEDELGGMCMANQLITPDTYKLNVEPSASPFPSRGLALMGYFG